MIRTLRSMVVGLFERTRVLHGPTMLLAGSAWDWMALQRIDELWDNLFLAGTLAALAVVLIAERLIAHGRRPPWPLSRWPWLVMLASQFLFGTLFSAYVVYYAKSTAAGRAGLFVGMLVALLIANELANERMRGDVLRFVLFFLCAFSFTLFFVPVVTGVLIGFGAAGLVAMAMTLPVVTTVLVLSPKKRKKGQLLRRFSIHYGAMLALLVTLMGLGQLGVIPPVPLSLQHGGIYHEVDRTEEGYRLVWEPQSWLPWKQHDEVFHYQEGDEVHCFTAIFAPREMELEVVHRWSWWNEKERTWEVTDTLPLPVEGGREAGWRTFTHKRHVKPGHWRVDVRTPDGRTLGEVFFELVMTPPERTLVQRFY